MSDDPRNPALPVKLPDDDDLASRFVPDPVMLVQGLRYLRQRMPELIQLTLREEQSMARAAYLDPEWIAAGLHAAGAWSRTEAVTGRTAEQLRAEEEAIRRWDDVERELRAFLEGIAGANLKRRHRLGSALLVLYQTLGMLLDEPANANMRSFHEEMKRLFARKKRSKPSKGDNDTPE